jgi:hypothetical protein
MTDSTDPLPILFWVCSWCTTRDVLARLNRDWPGQISHTACAACVARMMAELEAAS